MKFRMKMTLCMLWVLSLLFGIGGSLLISVSFQYSLEREKDMAYNSYKMILGTLWIVNELDPGWDYEGIKKTLEQLNGQNASAWAALLLASDRESIYESGEAARYIKKEMEQAGTGKCLFRYDTGPEGRRCLILSGEVAVSEDTLYLYMVHDISTLYDIRRYQQQTYFWVFAAMAFLCAVLSYTVSRVLTAPLEGLSRATRAISSGEYKSRVLVRSKDEIGAVSEDFNAMAAKMEVTVSELQSAVERQERFMGSFAHELKNPMTSIIGYSDLIRSETLTQEEQTEAAGYIFSESKRLEGLSRKLLELLVLKNHSIYFVQVSPAGLVEDLVEQWRPLCLAENIRLSCRCEKGLCLLEPDLFRSLLLNLVDNSRKALEQGGNIELYLNMLDDGCRLIVQDNGYGIPKEAMEHLTEAFYRVDKARSRERGGVGLGLALCKDIADLHHGAISFQSRQGEGMCVTVELRGGRQ